MPTATSVLSPELLGCHRFRAMNTDVQLLVQDLSHVDLLVRAQMHFDEVEGRLSRFRPDSELCALNRRDAGTVRVSPLMADVLAQALRLYRLTEGLFDPAILPDLERAGYDRSFEMIAVTDGLVANGSQGPCASIGQLRLDPSRCLVAMPAGMRLDLGGIGKGYTVDLAARLLEPAANFLIDAGGDIYASGNGPDGDGWVAGIADPFGLLGNIAIVRLRNEALATSTTAVRHWRRGGRELHHLINPRTGEPSRSGVVSASVIAPCATEADVFAKAALLLGPADGARFLDLRGVTGLMVLDDGSRVATERWNTIVEM